MKPLAIPDRWDDFSVAVAGWVGNGVWDQESFSDLNGNGLHDSGEPFVDGSNSGPQNEHYDEEFYHPGLTGLVASQDLGLQLSLKPTLSSGSIPKIYYAVNLPGSTEADFRWNLANCNPAIVGPGDLLQASSSNLTEATAQGLRDLINRDPSAYWDGGCKCVISGPNDRGDDNPRTLMLAVIDPRIALTAASLSLHVVKLVGFFLESQQSNGAFTGRLTTAQGALGTPCETVGAGFLYDCAVPTDRATWGEIKSRYR